MNRTNFIKLVSINFIITFSSAYAGLVDDSPLVKGPMIKSPLVYEGKSRCNLKVPTATREMLFDFFYTTAKNNSSSATSGLKLYSKMIGKLFAESSGNAAALSDMGGHGSSEAVKAFYNNDGKASISIYKKLRSNSNITKNYKTNVGLLQISVDQLYWRPAVRSLFENTIQRFNKDPEAGLKMCGTTTVYSDNQGDLLKEFDSFQSCKVGTKTKIVNKSTVPVVSSDEFNCFDRWMAFCPTLNIGIGMLLPSAYFETAGVAPLCEAELTTILKAKK
jgi:hypothetical protein